MSKCVEGAVCTHEGHCHIDCGGDHYYYTDGVCLKCGAIRPIPTGGNMTNILKLKSDLRLLEGDLLVHQIDLPNAMKIASDLEQSVEFLKEQIALIKAQIARCTE